jgi:RNA polymerase sigma factor (sigma-70 family)
MPTGRGVWLVRGGRKPYPAAKPRRLWSVHAHADPGPSARDRAFERLYRRYVADVYRYTLALLRNPADAEDITQTTFLNAYRAYRRGEEPLKPQNWLIKIAHNACRTRYIRASRRPVEVPLEHSLRELAVPADEIPNVKEVLDALARLPFNQRAAIVMRELEGRSYVEIAQALDLSVPAVETLIFRARRALRVRRAALRSLAALPLPASLTSFSGGGAAIGGGALIGTGILLKAVLAVGVGVVAGTAGVAVEARILAPDRGVDAAQGSVVALDRGSAPSALTSRGARTSVAGTRARKVISGVAIGHARDASPAAKMPRRAAGKAPGGADQGTPEGAAPAAPAAAPPSAPAPSGSPAAQSPTTTVTETVPTAVPTPPAVPAPPVAAPAVPVPAVSPPAVPEPPAVPLPVEPPPPPPLPPPPSLP